MELNWNDYNCNVAMKLMSFELNFSEQLFLWWLLIMVIIFIWHAWTDTYGNIHYAASEGKLDKVRKYLERGVFVDVQKNQGPTPLYVASATGHREIVEFLIAYGATVNQGLDEENGMNPLLAATVEEHQDVIESLMARGAVASIHVATFRGEIHTLRTYLEGGGDINAKQNGMSLLHLAVLGNHQETVRLLLANNADINIGDLNGEAPLYGAVTKNHIELAELLIERGGNLNQISAQGSPLHLAIWLKRREIVTLLVERGADVNIHTRAVEPPLHNAAKLGLLEVAELLLANGAEVNAQAKLDAKTPLHYAVWKGNLEMVELLIEWGANVNSRSSFGATPLSNARGNRVMIALLLAHGATDYGLQD